MTNYEKFKDQINENPLFAVKDGQVESCADVTCSDCGFNMEESCICQRFEWCTAEYHEPEPKEEPKEEEKTIYIELTGTDKVTCATYLASLVIGVCKGKDIDLMDFVSYLRGLDSLDYISGGKICHS